jgi:hypothetical protein
MSNILRWDNINVNEILTSYLRDKYGDILEYRVDEIEPNNEHIVLQTIVDVLQASSEFTWHDIELFSNTIATNRDNLEKVSLSEWKLLSELLIRRLSGFINSVDDLVLFSRFPKNIRGENHTYFQKHGLFVTLSTETQRWDTKFILTANVGIGQFAKLYQLTKQGI